MSNKWRHSICDKCWELRCPAREPVRLKDISKEICCFCGEFHFSGIFVREDPEELLCKGIH